MGLPDNCGLDLKSKWPHGNLNLITDVPGIKVGQITKKQGDINTGVTAILPHEGNIFKEKVMAGATVINGFGKSTGILQINELGTLETPIIMTNTLSVGTAYTALAKYMLAQNSDIGVETGTVNCVVTECNDGPLNDIRGFHIEEEDVFSALDNAAKQFDEGAAGGGTGMTCLGLKGGIGSSSRIISADGSKYTIGSIVMANFGSAGNLVVGGQHFDTTKPGLKASGKDTGSIIMITATDVPLSERQLNRVAKRAMIALGRVGSYCGNGSGDISIAFTTANKIPHYSTSDIMQYRMFYDENIDRIFEASVESIEESIISALYHAETTVGIRGKVALGLRSFLDA